MSEKQPKGDKTPEELYLEELYRAMDTGEVPKDMVPPQISSLQNSDYQFRKITLPSERRKSLLSRVRTAGRILSEIYLVVGLIVFFSVLREERLSIAQLQPAREFTKYAEDMFVLLFWVFALGAAIAAASSILTLAMRVKDNPVRKFLPFAVLVVCFAFAVVLSRVI